MRRYFIVFSRKLLKDNDEMFGNLSIERKNFPCCVELMKDLMNEQCKAVAITGINEITKADFESWTQTKETT